jgi:DNA modification methylase
MVELNKIYNEDCRSGLSRLADNSVNCCVTSPPYWGLRDYQTATWIGGDTNCNHYRDNQITDKCTTGHTNLIGGCGDSIFKDICKKCGAKRIDQQLGLEKTPEEYVAKLVDIFREVKRVLKNDATLWLNLGDSYWGGKGQSSQAWSTENQDRDTLEKSQHQISGKGQTRPSDGKHESIKPKDLVGIPWMVAFALRADGWYLRQDIIWSKPNPMPESVTDRCTKAHEYIFLLSKSAKYYYDQESIKYPVADTTILRMAQQIENQKGSERVPGKTNGNMKAVGNIIGDGMANKKSVWTVATKPFKEAHFATFPPALIVDCIKAGCPEDGIVIDPFIGAGTTAVVARKLNRNFIGFELNPKYVKMANNRLHEDVGLFL